MNMVSQFRSVCLFKMNFVWGGFNAHIASLTGLYANETSYAISMMRLHRVFVSPIFRSNYREFVKEMHQPFQHLPYKITSTHHGNVRF